MATSTDKPLIEAEGKLTVLLGEIRGTPLADRVKLYVAKFTAGRALADYLHDYAVPLKERVSLAKALVEILLKQDYTRLPDAPVVAAPAVVSPPAVEVESDDDQPIFTRAEVERICRKQLAEVLKTVARVLDGS